MSTSSKTVVVPARIVIKHGNRPSDPGNCSAVVFAQWKDVPGTTAATVSYVWQGEDHSVSGKAPFPAKFNIVATYRVPEGYRWIVVGYSHADGPTPNDCSQVVSRIKPLYSANGASAELTVVQSAKCVEALHQRSRWAHTYQDLEDEHAKGVKIPAFKSKASNALKNRALWSARVKAACS